MKEVVYGGTAVEMADEKLHAMQKYLSEAIVATMNCAQRAGEEGMGCAKRCQATSDLCQTALKWLTMRYENTAQLLNLVGRQARECRDDCIKRQTDHCQRCAKACDQLVVALEPFMV